MTKEEAVNLILTDKAIDKNKISDGYHTFGELYDHRIQLFITLCEYVSCSNSHHEVWKSRKHSDDSEWDGWFILGITMHGGKQISYHIPIKEWDNCPSAMILTRAPKWDGHTSADVLERLKSL